MKTCLSDTEHHLVGGESPCDAWCDGGKCWQECHRLETSGSVCVPVPFLDGQLSCCWLFLAFLSGQEEEYPAKLPHIIGNCHISDYYPKNKTGSFVIKF